MAQVIDQTWCIVTANGSRARFFTLESPEIPLLQGGPDLVEHDDLVNPEQWLRPQERFANLKSGRHRAPGGGPAHGFDDHRSNHVDEDEARFARRLAENVRAFAEDQGARYLVLCADPRLLGMLRTELAGWVPDELEVREHATDVSGLTRPQIHDRLASAGIVPRREPPPERPARRV